MSSRPLPIDRHHVGLSLVLMGCGLSMLVYALIAKRLGLLELPEAAIGVLYGIAGTLLALHFHGVLLQLSREQFTRPLPVFVCVCLNLLVAVLIVLGMLIA